MVISEKKVLISFIIPAHNAAATLTAAVESILAPTVNPSEVEVLIVENGSMDQTTKVAEMLSQQYDSVQLLHSEKGVSCARNEGIQSASGAWIFFLDADDCMTEHGTEYLLRDARQLRSDLLMYSYQVGGQIKTVDVLKTGLTLEQTKAALISNPTLFLQVWSKLFRRVLAVQCKFDERLHVSEDSDFTIQYLQVCRSIQFSREIVYHYALNPYSVMRTKTNDKLEAYLQAMKITSEKLDLQNTIYKAAFYDYVLMHMNIAMVREVFVQPSQTYFLEQVRRLKTTCSQKMISDALDEVSLGRCRSLRMLPVLLLKLKLYVSAGMVYAFRAGINTQKERAYNYRMNNP